MVMQDIKLTTEKHAHASQAISMVMWIRRYGAERIAQYSRSRATLDATGHHNWARFAPYRPGGCHGHRYQRKKSSCGVVKMLFQN
jgi:hypothetical protein